MGSLVTLLLRILSKLPFGLLYLLSDILLFPLLFYVLKYRVAVVRTNLENSFPDKSKEELRQIKKQYYRNLADIIVETLKVGGITQEQVNQRCDFENTQIADELTRKGKNIIAVMGHMGNWEMLAIRYPSIAAQECLYVYKPIKDKAMDDYARSSRGKFGGRLIPMKETFDAINETNAQGKHWLLALIADQAPRPQKSYWMNFLHQPTPVFFGPERIARQENAALMYISGHRTKRGHYTYRMNLIAEDCSNFKHGEITEIHAKMLEKDICAYPADWTWSHRRWKHKMPENLPQEAISTAFPPRG